MSKLEQKDLIGINFVDEVGNAIAALCMTHQQLEALSAMINEVFASSEANEAKPVDERTSRVGAVRAVIKETSENALSAAQRLYAATGMLTAPSERDTREGVSAGQSDLQIH